METYQVYGEKRCRNENRAKHHLKENWSIEYSSIVIAESTRVEMFIRALPLNGIKYHNRIKLWNLLKNFHMESMVLNYFMFDAKTYWFFLG